jgi:hypothetical protein
MELLDRAGEAWTEQLIENRTSELIGYITEIWPAPQGHISSFVGSPRQDRRRTTIADLIGAGLLESGATLYPRKKRRSCLTAESMSPEFDTQLPRALQARYRAVAKTVGGSSS